MRILHVVPSYLPAVRYGGPIHSVHGLARAQAELGHGVEVFTTNIDGESVSDVPVAVPVMLDGVKVTYFAVAGGRRFYRAPKMAPTLRARIRDFDIVHLHSVFLWPTTTAAAIARANDVSYVLSPRGMLWREMIARRSRLAKQAWIALFERRNVERAAAVHVTAELEAAKLDEFGFRLPPVITLANGVDEPMKYSMREVAPDIRVAAAEPGYALSFGRVHWKKNLAALLRALATQPHLRLVIAGNDEDGEAEQLRCIVGELGIGPRVTILARQISGADKEHLFANAGLFALPSLSENFGNTVLEAMIRALPVVASTAAGAADIVRQSGGGICCLPTAECFSEVFADYARRPAAYARMGRAGRRAAIEDFSWTAIAQKMTDAYPVAAAARGIAA